MKLIKYAIIMSTICGSTQIAAMDKKRCTSNIFKNFETLENTGHSKVLARPKGDLLRLSHQYEIACPWQVEADFNGDKRLDWVGVAQKDGQYQLIAYLSGPKKHFYRVIKTYPSFPSKSYISSTPFKRIFEVSKGKIPSIYPASKTFVENTLGDFSVVYAWVDNEVKEIFRYEGEFKLQAEKIEKEKEQSKEQKKSLVEER